MIFGPHQDPGEPQGALGRSKTVRSGFWTAAFDAQADVQRSQSYEGIVRVFRSALKPQCVYSDGLKRFFQSLHVDP